MNLITRFELASKSASELRSLYGEVFNALVRSEPGTPGRRKAGFTRQHPDRTRGMDAGTIVAGTGFRTIHQRPGPRAWL
jgi:hypothetical protein